MALITLTMNMKVWVFEFYFTFFLRIIFVKQSYKFCKINSAKDYYYEDEYLGALGGLSDFGNFDNFVFEVNSTVPSTFTPTIPTSTATSSAIPTSTARESSGDSSGDCQLFSGHCDVHEGFTISINDYCKSSKSELRKMTA